MNRSGVIASGGTRRRSIWRRLAAVAGGVLAAAAVLADPGTATAAPPQPVLAFSPAPYDFGRVTAGATVARDVTLANTGNKATGPLRVRLTGADAFRITGDTCRATRLRPGRTCTVTVRFAPTGEGQLSATLTATSTGHRRHGRPVRATDLLTGTGGLLGGAEQAGQVYWSQSGTQRRGQIWTAGVDGSNPHTVATGQTSPAGVAVDSDHLYWASNAGRSIIRAGLDGSDPQPIVTGQAAPFGLAVSAGQLFWSNGGDNGSIWTAGADGSDPHPIVTQQADPEGLAADADHVYWATDDAIWQAGLDGGDAHSIVTGLGMPFGVAVTANHLYWADMARSAVYEAGLDGSSPHAVITGLDTPAGVAVAGQVYWSEFGNATSPTSGSVGAAGLDGGSARTIVSGQTNPVLMAVTPALTFAPSAYDYGRTSVALGAPQAITLTNTTPVATGPLAVSLTGAGDFSITSNSCAPAGLAAGQTCTVVVEFAPGTVGEQSEARLTATSASLGASAAEALAGTGAAAALYWTAGDTAGQLWKAGLDGSAPESIVSGQHNPFGVAATGNRLFWADAGDGTIWSSDIDGGNAAAIVTGEASPLGVAVSGARVYWTDNEGGSIRSAALDGSDVRTVLTGQNLPFGLAATATQLFWSNGDGTVRAADLDGSRAHVVFTQTGVTWLAIGDQELYWSNSSGTISVALLDGTDSDVLLSGLGAVNGLVTGGTSLYWAAGLAGTINQSDLGGDSPQPIVTGQTDPIGVAVTQSTP